MTETEKWVILKKHVPQEQDSDQERIMQFPTDKDVSALISKGQLDGFKDAIRNIEGKGSAKRIIVNIPYKDPEEIAHSLIHFSIGNERSSKTFSAIRDQNPELYDSFIEIAKDNIKIAEVLFR